tara:strand:+ start:1208 stop:2125 length:918 start_codon:yes stop_codon:yes gene_type:complete
MFLYGVILCFLGLTDAASASYSPDVHSKIAIVYAFYQTDNALENVDFFRRHAVHDCKNYDYWFVVNGDKADFVLPKQSNVKVLYRRNRGGDFAAWSYALSKMDLARYDAFIFLNDTVRGPFLPRYLTMKYWPYYFTRQLDARIKLTGASVNKMLHESANQEHVQSMAFATDKVGLRVLLDADIFSEGRANDVLQRDGKLAYIKQFEVAASQSIRQAGYYIDGLNTSVVSIKKPYGLYANTYWSRFMQWIMDRYHSDLHYDERSNYGLSLHPLEVMFIKTNRIDNLIIQQYTAWQDARLGAKGCAL